MRSPVLIAETPFAGGHGPRFLAPPGRGVDADTSARYIGRAREVEDDVEEIEGDDFLAVRLARTDEATGHTAPETLVLAGIDVDRMGGDDRDEVLEQLRERLEVLADAVAAVNWSAAGHSPVIEIPELEEWHEAGWDALPRAGPWADPAGAPTTDHFGGVAQVEMPGEPPALAGGWPDPEPDASTSQSDESVEDAGDPFRFGPESEPVPESAATTPEPALPEPKPDPVPDVIVPAREPPAPAPGPPPEPVTAPALRIDQAPVSRPAHAKNVSESVDRSPALALPPAAPATAAPRWWWPRWYVWVPWTAVAVLLTAKYLYLTEIDRTWNQRITETAYVQGPTRVIETVIEKPVERIVERPVEKVVTLPTVPGADSSKDDQWGKFASDYRTALGRGELLRAADLLATWKVHLPAWGPTAPPGLADLQAEFRTSGPNKLREWAADRSAEHRFGDAYAALAALAAAEPVKALLGPTAPAGLASQARAGVRAAEDQYHYTQLRTLTAADPVPEDRLTQHINAYLSLVEPPGRMLGEVQALAEYRKWLKAGRPAEAVVRVEWGLRTAAGEHTIEITLGGGADGKPLKTVTRTVTAEPGGSWSEAIPVEGVSPAADGVVPYRVKTVRPTSPVEELAEGAQTRTEMFLLDAGRPLTAADEPESGTKVAVEWRGLVARPSLPAWKAEPSPVVPVSLPKVGQ
ncbi:MAG TPA: hypothetical protein VKE40_10740 [Gemmataceae bacterium]|nr:hypothetical protein [Gemmataceae bacterium]